MCQFLQWWCKSMWILSGAGFLSGENKTGTRVWCLSCCSDGSSESRAFCANCCEYYQGNCTVHCNIATWWNVCISNPFCLLYFLGVFNTKILIILKHAYWLHVTKTEFFCGMRLGVWWCPSGWAYLATAYALVFYVT